MWNPGSGSADVGIGRIERLAALIGGDRSGGARVVGNHTRADGRAAGEQGHGLGRAAVVAQRGQAQAGEAGQNDVAVDPIDQPPEPPVPIRLLLPETLTEPRDVAGAGGIGVAGDDGVDQVGRAVVAAAAEL